MRRLPRACMLLAAAQLRHPLRLRSTTLRRKRCTRLTSVRAKIKAKDFKGAIAELTPMLAGHPHAEVYNLMGFGLRKTGDYQQAYTFYRKALDFDPEHKSALEYLGELYVETGQIEKATENLALLKKLCPGGCEELSDLNRRSPLRGRRVIDDQAASSQQEPCITRYPTVRHCLTDVSYHLTFWDDPIVQRQGSGTVLRDRRRAGSACRIRNGSPTFCARSMTLRGRRT